MGNPQDFGGAVQTISIKPLSQAKLLQTQIDIYDALNLRPLFKEISDTENLDFEWLTLGEGAVTPNVKENEKVMIQTAKWGKEKFTILKDVGHIFVTDEASKRSKTSGVNQIEMQRAQLGPAFAKEVEAKMVDALDVNPLTFTAAADWSLSTTNPIKDINKASILLRAGNLNQRYLVMNQEDAADLTANEKYMTFIMSENYRFDADTVGPGFRIITDINEKIPAKTAYLASGEGVGYWVNGEVKQEPYRDTGVGDGLMITMWNGVSGAIMKRKQKVGATTYNDRNAGVVKISLV